MAKITLVFSRPGKEYKQQDADSLIRDLDGLIDKLNTTFQQDLREEEQRQAFEEKVISSSDAFLSSRSAEGLTGRHKLLYSS